jgi:hypothetical protein
MRGEMYEGAGMKVLVACEFSGIVRDAFIARGHDAVSCDLLPTERPGSHIQDDVLNHLNEGWDLMIAHPPCTYICNSGARWQHVPGRAMNMSEARDMFYKLLNAQRLYGINKICIENPIPNYHLYDNGLIEKYTQIIQPWMFGHGETKATCLWLKNLPKLKPTNIVDGREQRIHRMSPGPNRGKDRSRSYPGIAAAMAEQWGSLA